MSREGRGFTPVLGDVNGDGYVDLLISQQGSSEDMWRFDQARLFLNNQDGTFTENVNMLPTTRELRDSNPPSPIHTHSHMFVPLTLVDFTNDGYSDLYFSSGRSKLQGALFKNNRNTNPNNKQWSNVKTTDSIILGEKTMSSSGCGSTSTYPIGHVFFDGKNHVAWRVYPNSQNFPVIQMYTMLPRCKLTSGSEGGTTCGVGSCSSSVTDVLYGLKCECPASYVGSKNDDGGELDVFNSYCRSCTTGSVNTDGIGICNACHPGYWSNITYSAVDPTRRAPTTHCIPCGIGRFGPEKMSKRRSGCLSCPSGRFSNLLTATSMEECKLCTAGKYSISGDSQCRNCPRGYYQPQIGQPFCFPCIPGTYQSEMGKESCNKCEINTYSDEPALIQCINCPGGKTAKHKGAARCNPCAAGEYSSGIKTCHKCEVGKYREGDDIIANRCIFCPSGFYSNKTGSSGCLNCFPGQSQPNEGQISCLACPKGKLQPNAGSSSCNDVPPGKIVGTGSSSFITVPPGQFIKKSGCPPGNDDCNPFSICPAGTIGTENRLECTGCPSGKTSLPGSIDCHACPKGKYKNGQSNSTCSYCPQGYYQEQEIEPSSFCIQCPTGWEQKKEGETSCTTLGWLTTKHCGEDEFLNDTDSFEGHWKCVKCMAGASCAGNVAWKDVTALFGWARCKGYNATSGSYESMSTRNKFDTFERCSFPAACLGAENKDVEANYNFVNQPITRNESCSKGYLNPSRMCHACAPGYSHDNDLNGRCSVCPTDEANVGAAVGGCIAGILGLVVYLMMVISDGGLKGYGDAFLVPRVLCKHSGIG